MEHLDKADQFANWFDAFIKHASLVSILLAILGSWCATALFKIPLRIGFAGRWQAFSIRLFDVLVAFGLCASTWPNEWRWQWAFVVGVASPSVYWLLAAFLCWKWPGLKPYVALRELASDSTDSASSSDADPPVPPSSN